MKVLLVDDEQHNREGIKILLNRCCPYVEVVGEADGAEQARTFLYDNVVDVVLLDIKMPKESGFEFLDSLTAINFLTVFITAYDEYAIRAFKANAMDYLLKPVDEEELITAMEKCKNFIQDKNRVESLTANNRQQNMQEIVQSITEKTFPSKIMIPFSNGFQMVEVEQITHLVADGNYTNLFFMQDNTMLTSRSIGDFEEILNPELFFRIHKSTIVNMQFMKSYSSSDGHEVVLKNGIRLALSRRRLEEFMLKLSQISRKM